MKVSENAVNAALRVLTGKALFLKPEEMRAALEAAVPYLLADVADERRKEASP